MPKQTYSRMWEQVNGVITGGTYRMKVPGGWLVKEQHTPAKGEAILSIVFIPDSKHAWALEADIRDEQMIGALKDLDS